jgi:transcriptional regulator with XRE-family HTH domain
MEVIFFMKEINIGKVLVNKRKEKGITQDELANYIGVSKASVSKWETGQSYPDVTFLPQLAAYFNISIDDLMNYKPQMTKEDIRKLYHKLSADFVSKPFVEVMDHCRTIIKKYYACFPLLQQIGMLFLNHGMLAGDAEKREALIGEAKELFVRVTRESENVELAKQALYAESSCCMALGDANAALELLEGISAPSLYTETLLIAAHQMTGQTEKAKTALQAAIYQHIVALCGLFPSYFALYQNDSKRYEEGLRRVSAIADAFAIKRLHPGVLANLYISAAQGYAAQGNKDNALDMLQQYTELVTGNIYPLRLQGDDFFNLLDNWLNELDLGTAPPRDEKTIKKSMADTVISNPAFSALTAEPRFQRIAEKLENNS